MHSLLTARSMCNFPDTTKVTKSNIGEGNSLVPVIRYVTDVHNEIAPKYLCVYTALLLPLMFRCDIFYLEDKVCHRLQVCVHVHVLNYTLQFVYSNNACFQCDFKRIVHAHLFKNMTGLRR